MDEAFTKHLPFSLMAKKLKEQIFEAWSLNHFRIFNLQIILESLGSCASLKQGVEQRIKKSQIDLRIELQNFGFL